MFHLPFTILLNTGWNVENVREPIQFNLNDSFGLFEKNLSQVQTNDLIKLLLNIACSLEYDLIYLYVYP